MKLSTVLRKVRDACPPDCRCCEEACAGALAPHGAVIRSDRVHRAPLFKNPTCSQCGKPVCLDACPSGAIVKDPEDGIVRVNEADCAGCESCVSACPDGHIFMDPAKGVAFKCDMCRGEPECAKACPLGVLEHFKAHALQSDLHDTDFLAKGTRACAGCPAELALRTTLRAFGNREAVVFGCPGCMTTLMIGSETRASIRLPYVNCLFTNVPSTMTGVYEYYRHLGREPNLIAFVGDGSVSDASFQALSGAAERGERITVICYDNEGYMNTGIQRSSTTPFGAKTKTSPVGEKGHGKRQNSKYMPLIMVSHDIPYVATANPAYPQDYIPKVKKALEVKNGMSYIHLLAPCPTGWAFRPETGIQVAQAAVVTNYFPLWEYENGTMRMTREVKSPQPISAFTRLTGRFSHLTEDERRRLQEWTDERLARIRSWI